MGILRADILTHSQLEPSGSVFFDGNSDYLSWSNDSVKVGTSDFTLEAWVNITGNNDATQHQTIFMAGDSSDAGELVFQMIRDTGGGGSVLGSGADREIGIRVAGTGYYSGQQITFNQWHHVAVVRDGGAITFFLDGEAGKSHTMTENLTTGFTQIGYRDGSYNGYFKGYISNARIALGAIYKNNFTPSKFELKNVAGTLLLCCQSSTSATTAEVVPSAITANGTAAAASFHPDLKKDITDTGVVFDGFGNFATSTYMVPPTGKTTERNRGRGVFGGGFNGVSPNVTNAISYVEVQSGGIFKDFGDLTLARGYSPAGQTSSSTRGIFAGGYGGGGGYNTIDFITIANTGNAIDFGDISVAKFGQGGLSNQTRALFGGNQTAPFDNIIEFVTIATTGNAQDFGDLVKQRGLTAGASSSTRGVFTGGRSNTPSSNAQDNIMEYVTIATTGNTQDFGDLSTTTRYGHTGFSSPTRGISAGGFDPSGQAKTIDYFTIATLGNSLDFGDLSAVTGYCGSVTNSTRGAVTINNQPNYYNTLEFITIATLGDAQDFGDADVGSSKGHGDFPACASDSHGGVA